MMSLNRLIKEMNAELTCVDLKFKCD